MENKSLSAELMKELHHIISKSSKNRQFCISVIGDMHDETITVIGPKNRITIIKILILALTDTIGDSNDYAVLKRILEKYSPL